MANSLNARIYQRTNTIAQGDTASTIQIELLDHNLMNVTYLDGSTAKVNLVRNGTIEHSFNVRLFYQLLEFNLPSTIRAGTYTVSIVVNQHDETYVFPSSQDLKIHVIKSYL